MNQRRNTRVKIHPPPFSASLGLTDTCKRGSNAGTTQVEINMPPEHPIRSVSVPPMPGWTFVAEKTPLATPINVASTTDVDDASRNGVIGIVIGAVALLAALAALAMRGKKAGTDTSRV